MPALHLPRTAFRTKAPSMESSSGRSTAARRTAPTSRVAFVPTYQFEPASSKGSAFCWITGEPSIFMADRSYTVASDKGESRSELATRVTREFELTHGRSRGSIFGISEAADKQAEEFARQKRLRRKVAA